MYLYQQYSVSILCFYTNRVCIYICVSIPTGCVSISVFLYQRQLVLKKEMILTPLGSLRSVQETKPTHPAVKQEVQSVLGIEGASTCCLLIENNTRKEDAPLFVRPVNLRTTTTTMRCGCVCQIKPLNICCAGRSSVRARPNGFQTKKSRSAVCLLRSRN